VNIQWRASSQTNDYYAVQDAAHAHSITVVHTKFDTFVCLTCRYHLCEHAVEVEKHVASKGLIKSEP
jgi:hypothetical protein